MATYTRDLTVNLGAALTGLAGSLAYTVRGADGTVLVARTTAGVAEVGPGLYSVPVANWDTSWSGRVDWDAGAGLLTFESFEPTATAAPPGPSGSGAAGVPSAAAARLAAVYATDEDLAIAAAGDFAVLIPKDQKLASGTDGAFASADRWTLTSPSSDFGAQGVVAGSVVQLSKPTSAFRSTELMVVDSVAGSACTLRRKALAAGVGAPPAPAAGLTGVEFAVATFFPQIERASYEINRRFRVDEQVAGRRAGDLYDPRELTEATVQLVLWWTYADQARQAGPDRDTLWAKARMHAETFAEIERRTVAHFTNAGEGAAAVARTRARIVR